MKRWAALLWCALCLPSAGVLLRYGVRFEPQDMDEVQPVPAGLLGPIRLVATGASRKR